MATLEAQVPRKRSQETDRKPSKYPMHRISDNLFLFDFASKLPWTPASL